MDKTKKKPIIAIDIDDVLSDNAYKFIKYSNDRWGFSFTINDYTEHWGELWQVDNAEVCKRSAEYHTSGVLSKYCHDLNSIVALNKLKNDFDLIIVTSRNEVSKSETVAWIKNKYPGLFSDETINFTNFFNVDIKEKDKETLHLDKGDICRKLDAKYIIDDQPKHCLGAAKHGITALLFGNYPWNQLDNLPKGVYRVNDWNAILEYFYGKPKV